MIKKLLIPVFIFSFFTASVQAQEDSGQSPTRDNNLGQRTNERIQRLNVDLDTGQVQALKARCKAAQNKIDAVRKAAKTYSSTQNRRVETILNNVRSLSEKLTEQNVDTTRLDQKLEEIESLKNRIDSTYDAYNLALNDSAKIDCEAIPEGFRVSVDDAKKQFSELRQQRKTLRESIKQDLKQTLIELRDNI